MALHDHLLCFTAVLQSSGLDCMGSNPFKIMESRDCPMKQNFGDVFIFLSFDLGGMSQNGPQQSLSVNNATRSGNESGLLRN